MTLKKYPAVTAFGTGFDSMPFVAYKSEWKVAADTVKKVPAGRKEGLIVLDPAAGRMDTVLRVDKFVFDRTGSLLAYSVKKDKKDTTTASAMMLASLPVISVGRRLSPGMLRSTGPRSSATTGSEWPGRNLPTPILRGTSAVP